MIEGIITHPRPHFDEIVALFWLFMFGEDKYPGVKDAITNKRIYFVRAEDLEASADRYEESGYILIGIGGGRFDEHGTNGDSGRKQNECAATLVAKDLGINELPELSKILQFVINADLKGIGNPFDVAYMVKLLNAQFPDDPFTAINFAFTALKAKFREQYEFHVEARREFEAKAQIEEILVAGRVLKMVTIVTDSEMVNKYVRSEFGGGADIIVQQNTSGQVQIFTDRKSGINLTDTAQMLRLIEQNCKGKFITTDWETLASEGKVDGAEEWYFFPKGQMLLNGSQTARDVPPTRIELDLIKNVVKVSINSAAFEPNRAQQCRQGICTSTVAAPCPWYPYGLQRCRQNLRGY